MQGKTISMHINLDELVKSRIPALREKAAENNKLVLEQIALNGPLLPYDVKKNLNTKSKGSPASILYSTINRRIKDLKKRGYLAIAGKRLTERGKRTEEPAYGLTWRGFIASLSIAQVRENILQTLEKNPLLTLPEKQSILAVLKEIVTPQELGIITKPIFEAYLNAIPNVEMIRDDQLWIWLFAIDKFPKLPENFEFSRMPKDLVELLDRPPILKFVKEEIVPLVRQRTMEIKTIYEALRPLDQLCEYVLKLEDTNKPSKRIREYMQNKVPNNLRKKEEK
ncbi:hypothetical protein MUP77_25280 [Candidatus Bathyarchaeota archaeon]|nr:hypothetical protein [Candidatus Bathyarchaeota archaeon]